MKTRIIPFIAILIAYVQPLLAEDLRVQNLKTGHWIKEWLLVGPIHFKEKTNPNANQWSHFLGFETDYLQSAGGEKKPVLKDGTLVKFNEGTAFCKLHHSSDSMINVDLTISKDFPALVYAYTEIEAQEEGIYTLTFGSNDGYRLWLNGEQVYDMTAERGLVADDDRIPVYLKKGKNSILLKLEKIGGSRKFCMRFLPFSITEYNNYGKLFSVTPKADGTAELKSSISAPVLKQLIKEFEIEVVTDLGEFVLNEKRKSHFTGILKLNSSDYIGYKLKLKTTLNSGEILTGEIDFKAGKVQDYSLFSNQKSDYRIVVGSMASQSEKWAASELQYWLQEVSGIKIPIENTEANINYPAIYVGYNDKVKSLVTTARPDSTDESFSYCNIGQDIVIFGGSQRGTMYGVMSFLENEFGCRWYSPLVTVAPEISKYSFKRLAHSEKPGIRVRNNFYFEAFDPIWAARNRMNGTLGFDKTISQPGGTENFWAVHTFSRLVPPTEFFEKHPEYYSLIDGKRVHQNAQLCLSNPNVLKIITERIKKQMRENPDYLIYDVSQNDCVNPCQCENCQKIVKSEDSESGIVIWFVNQVAEAVENEFPNKFIGTLAYVYTRKPPKNIKPRANVVVRLCSIECCFSHDFQTCQKNQSFLADLKGWSAISPHLYIWDYVVNFAHYIMPFPNFNVLQSNIKILQQNHAIGIMEQAAYQSRGAEFAELRAYLISKLLWNPDCNASEVINDFMYGYYGRSGQYIKEYFDYLHNRITPETHVYLGVLPDDEVFSGSFVADAEAIFSKAKQVADNPELLRRVEMAELPVLYLKCLQTPEFAVYDGTYSKFTRIAEREGITHYAEPGKSQKDNFHRKMDLISR